MAAVSFQDQAQCRKVGDDLCRLVISSHKKHPLIGSFQPDPKKMKKFARGCVEGSAKTGVCEAFYKAGRLKAVFLFLNFELVPGLPMRWGFIETDRTSEAAQWALRRLKKHKRNLAGNAMIDLPVYLKDLLPQIYRAGFYIDTVRTVGEARTALRRLRKLGRQPVVPEGLTIKKLSRVSQLDEILKIERREFKRNPHFGFFVSRPAWLKQAHASRRKNMRNPKACLRVILRGKKVVGYFGYTDQTGWFKGKLCGTEFVFSKSIQGKGLSIIAYRILVEHMIKSKMRFFAGNTSQPAILKAAKKMGRVPQNFSLRVGKPYFPADFFEI